MLTFSLITSQAREGIKEVHFLPFNPVDKRTAITYIDSDGNWHRVSKGAPEQVVELLKLMHCLSLALLHIYIFGIWTDYRAL